MRAVRFDPVWAAVLLAVVGGCSSSPPAAEETGTFSIIYAQLFPVETKAQCNSCHAVASNEVTNGLLSTGPDRASAYAALVGKDSVSKRCAGKPLIVPNQPDQSLFLQKLVAAPPCGDQMPLGGGHLSTAQANLVRSWIAAGALDD
jgi:mono/diheme cytochrome c family protein